MTSLLLAGNQLVSLPESIGNLTNLTELVLFENQITSLPESIGNLTNLTSLLLSGNQLVSLPESIGNLIELATLDLNGNPLIDLSILQHLPDLKTVIFLNVELPYRYWTKFSSWKAEWLLTENNIEIRRTLIEVLGYEKIFEELDAFAIDSWREYTLLEISNIENIYGDGWEPIGTESILLLRMICPSTRHTHVLRVPPEMVSAEDAVVWINHGIHPDQFTIQT